MPQEAKIFRVSIFKSLPAVFIAQVRSLRNGELLLAADVQSITYEVLDLDSTNPDEVIATGNLTVNQSMHELKRDARWSIDQVGYNFDHTIPGTIFTQSGRTYALRYLFVATGDTDPSAVLVYNVYVQNTRS